MLFIFSNNSKYSFCKSKPSLFGYSVRAKHVIGLPNIPPSNYSYLPIGPTTAPINSNSSAKHSPPSFVTYGKTLLSHDL